MRTQARYYDGETAGATLVELEVLGSLLKFDVGGMPHRIEIADTVVVEPVGKGPWIVELGSDASLHITDEAFGESISRIGGASGFVRTLEGAWHWALASVVVAVVAVWAILTFGVPQMARSVAFALPENAEVALRDEGLGIMDRLWFEESELPDSTRARIRALFEELQDVNPDFGNYRLEFRASKIGPNAFAVPGGIVVLTDELVELAETDEQIVAVLAHEVGHLYGRHSMRILLQNSVSALFIAGLTGDISNITALAGAVPTVLMHAKYSRDFESEADGFAFDYLQSKGISTDVLSELLLKLESEAGGSSVPGWLSSHPPSRQRTGEAQ